MGACNEIYDLSNKIVVITGGLRGIGLEIVKTFSIGHGATVIIADKDIGTSNTVISELMQNNKVNIDYHYLDLANNISCYDLVEYIKNKYYNKIDILINNARGGIKESVENQTEDNWNHTFDVNLSGAFFLSRACMDVMKENQSGTIVNLSSVSASFVSPESPAYQLSKAAIEQMTRVLAVYGGEFGIRVNAVSPGFIVQDEHQERFYHPDNEEFRNTAHRYVALKYIGSSRDVANTVLFLSSDMSRFITGQIINVDGGGYIQDPFHLLLNK